MKNFINILIVVFVLGLIASCAKEEIIPMNQDRPTKKGTSVEATVVGDKGDKDKDGEDQESDGDEDITDPENDLDFD